MTAEVGSGGSASPVPASEPCKRCAQRVAEARAAQAGSTDSCDVCALIRGFTADEVARKRQILESFKAAIRDLL